MRRAAVVLATALCAACAIDVQGSAPEATAAPPVTGSAPVAPPPAPPPPARDPADVTVAYAAGKDGTVYRFDFATKAFRALPSVGCPPAEEVAVTSDGTVYVTSSDSKHFFRHGPTGCDAVKRDSSFPYAFGVAPSGTIAATTETLVGYSGADYVSVAPRTGEVTMIGRGALGDLRPAGDLTAIGTRGFLAAQRRTGSGAVACPDGGDCIVEVDLKTGVPTALLSHHPGLGIYGLAQVKGSLLLFSNGQVFAYDLDKKQLGASLAQWPTGASFSGAGSAPFPRL